MDTLLNLLNQINNSSLSNSQDRVLNNLEKPEILELIQSATDLASTLLIDENGQCIWSLHSTLDTAGFEVFPGERDSFGWLTGCIQTSKGILIYG